MKRMLAGDRQFDLPAGVDRATWSRERVRHQNPRIRGLVMALNRMDQVLDSNYFILNCSVRQLREVWQQLRAVVQVIRNEILPHLEERSPVPRLEEARKATQAAYGTLEREVLGELGAWRDPVEGDNAMDLRRQLSRSIGALHGFLSDAYGRFLEFDPRSAHDADYFLSRRFVRHIAESEALYVAVDELNQYLREQGRVGERAILDLVSRLAADPSLPRGSAWQPVGEFLSELQSHLVPRLRAVLVLAGIRFSESSTIDGLNSMLELKCKVVTEFYELWKAVSEGTPAGEPPGSRPDAAIARGVSQHLVELTSHYGTLAAFVPSWLTALEKRRALMLRLEQPVLPEAKRRLPLG